MKTIPFIVAVLLCIPLMGQMSPEEARKALEAAKPTYEQLEAENVRLRAEVARLRLELAAANKRIAELEAPPQEEQAEPERPARNFRSVQELHRAVPAEYQIRGTPTDTAPGLKFIEGMRTLVGDNLRVSGRAVTVPDGTPNRVEISQSITHGGVVYEYKTIQHWPADELAKVNANRSVTVEGAITKVIASIPREGTTIRVGVILSDRE